MGKYDESDEDWVAEATITWELPAQNEFKRHLASLRRQAGYDLKWWEKALKGCLGLLGLKVRFK